jgi:predicted CXXCH cytochrome family protein
VEDAKMLTATATPHSRARRFLGRAPIVATLLVVSLSSIACREVVFRDRELFEEPTAGAQGFLGYADESRKLTVCGQCHVSFQNRWQETQHAQAWQTLQGAAGATQLCQACHTTNSRGNVLTGDIGGFFGHADSRYHDVQCEACHGPGLTHVRSPTRDNWPLATVAVGPTLTQGCGECHSGAHQPFVEQWAASRHANIRPAQAGNVNCQACHRGQGALTQFGVRAEYIERQATQHVAITCAVCHDPHDARNPGQLRFAIDARDTDQNLCMKCHQRRGEFNPAAVAGPHSPEGPLLLGEAGWFPPLLQFEPGTVVATHGSEANPRLCAGCHVNQYEIRDQLTGGFVFRSTGHTFESLPCVDAEGVPTGSRTCGLADRSFMTCAASGCHGTPGIARTRLELARDEIATLVNAMLTMEAQIPTSEFAVNSQFVTARGARFNRQLAQFRGSEVHNPVLIRALLRASIRQVQRDYGINPPPGVF